MGELVITKSAHKYTSKEADGRGGWVYHYDDAAVRRLHQAVAEAGFQHLNEAIAAHKHGVDPRLRRLPAKYRAQIANPPQHLDTSDPNVAEWLRQTGIDAGHGQVETHHHPGIGLGHHDNTPQRGYQHRMELSRSSAPLLLMKARKGEMKPGHRYTERHRDGDGHWRYKYEVHQQHTMARQLDTAPEQQVDMFDDAAPHAEPLSDAQRLAVSLDRVELQIRGLPREVAVVLDLAGNEIKRYNHSEQNAIGHYLDFSAIDTTYMRGKVFTHNHPIHPWGNSFSPEDVAFMIVQGIDTMRAVGGKYRYSIRNPKGFAAHLIMRAYDEAERKKTVELRAAIQAGTLSIDEANNRHAHEIWSELSSRYSLEYTREEWNDA